ncbi:hypothetical protein Goshw_016064 [Gossypium schwendimanii]|uniref:Uncharacterized protein n=1 Tax=Gossypium schwendimanii TaxID=34291 RepID=A0A7J9LGM7_GOSSC|nr:hypothetical protein [Gossypium schwendimanii]
MEISIEEHDNLGNPSIPRISAKASNKVYLHYEDPFDKKGMTADAQEEYQPDLSATMYRKSSLSMIGDMIRKVIKIAYNMASGARGRFARMRCLY